MKWRLLLSGLAALSLSLLLAASWQQIGPSTSSLTLLTPGFTGAVPAGWTLAWPGVQAAVPQIPDLGYLARHDPQLKTVTILGDGLRQAELARLPAAVRIIFPPPAEPAGLQTLVYPDAIQLGSPFVVEGTGKKATDLQVQWTNPAGKISSTLSGGTGRPAFRHMDLPPAAGRFVYHLKINGGDERPVGVDVQPLITSRVLIVENGPRFESRALKGWLGQQGFPISLRTRLGKEIFRHEELNGATAVAGPLNPSIWPSFDLLIIDSASIMGLTPEEQTALSTAVRIDGLGLLILPDATLSQLATHPLLASLLPFTWPAPGTDLQETRVTWPGRESALEGTVNSFATGLTPTPALLPLLLDPQGRLLAGAQRVGEGMIALSLLVESERWTEQGQPASFAASWSHLLSAIARAPAHASQWNRLAGGPTMPNDPVALELHTDQTAPQATWEDQSGIPHPLALEQSLFDPHTWTATCWPRSPGWQTIHLNQGATFYFYVSPFNAWPDLETARRHAETTLRAQPTETPRAPSHPDTLQIIFALCLLLSLSALWITERRGK